MRDRRRGIASAGLPHRLFVYGSLMCGETNHSMLGDGARLLGAARTAPRYGLVDLGTYPALIGEGSCAVIGELYEIDATTLRRLDRFEGHPELYRRAPVELASGEVVLAYFAGDRALRGRLWVLIQSGDWRSTRGSDASPCELHTDRPRSAPPR